MEVICSFVVNMPVNCDLLFCSLSMSLAIAQDIFFHIWSLSHLQGSQAFFISVISIHFIAGLFLQIVNKDLPLNYFTFLWDRALLLSMKLVDFLGRHWWKKRPLLLLLNMFKKYSMQRNLFICLYLSLQPWQIEFMVVGDSLNALINKY